MTISTQTRTVLYDGNGVATVFAYPFKISADTDLKVYLRNSVTGGFDLQTITTHYTVSGAGNPGGGNITFVTAPVSGLQNVFILRKTALTQLADYVTNDDFPAEVHEGALDKLTAALQDWIGDSLQYDPLTDRWDFQNRQTKNVPRPTASDGVANKQYVDELSLGGSGGGAIRRHRFAPATAGQTVFTLPFTISPGSGLTLVAINGVWQQLGDYTETSTTILTFQEGLEAGDVVDVFVIVPVGREYQSVPNYSVGSLPNNATAGLLAFVANESGGAVLAFSDGISWRRVTDRAVCS